MTNSKDRRLTISQLHKAAIKLQGCLDIINPERGNDALNHAHSLIIVALEIVDNHLNEQA